MTPTLTAALCSAAADLDAAADALFLTVATLPRGTARDEMRALAQRLRRSAAYHRRTAGLCDRITQEANHG